VEKLAQELGRVEICQWVREGQGKVVLFGRCSDSVWRCFDGWEGRLAAMGKLGCIHVMRVKPPCVIR